MNRFATKQRKKTNGRKREPEFFFQTDDHACIAL